MQTFRSYLHSTPRTLLFYFAVLIFLIATAISGLGYTFNSPAFLITGAVILIIWFVMIFICILPQTDLLLSKRMKLLKRGALIIFVSLFVLGVGDAVTFGIIVPRLEMNQRLYDDFRQVIAGWKDSYIYSDATALSQQAVENLLKGQNPYAQANCWRSRSVTAFNLTLVSEYIA